MRRSFSFILGSNPCIQDTIILSRLKKNFKRLHNIPAFSHTVCMKKIFFITALLALSAVSLAGCGGQSGKNSTPDKSSAQSTQIERDMTTDQPEEPETPAEDSCPEGNCPEHRPSEDGTKPRCPEGHYNGHELIFIFRAPVPEFFRGIMPPSEPISDSAVQISEDCNRTSRDKRPPRSRMPRKIPEGTDGLPQQEAPQTNR